MFKKPVSGLGVVVVVFVFVFVVVVAVSSLKKSYWKARKAFGTTDDLDR